MLLLKFKPKWIIAIQSTSGKSQGVQDLGGCQILTWHTASSSSSCFLDSDLSSASHVNQQLLKAVVKAFNW